MAHLHFCWTVEAYSYPQILWLDLGVKRREVEEKRKTQEKEKGRE